MAMSVSYAVMTRADAFPLRCLWMALLLVAVGLAAGCAGGATNPAAATPNDTETVPLTPTATPMPAVSATHSPTPSIGYKKGDLAPDFELTTADGQRVSLASLREQGKPLFLFFFAAW